MYQQRHGGSYGNQLAKITMAKMKAAIGMAALSGKRRWRQWQREASGENSVMAACGQRQQHRAWQWSEKRISESEKAYLAAAAAYQRQQQRKQRNQRNGNEMAMAKAAKISGVISGSGGGVTISVTAESLQLKISWRALAGETRNMAKYQQKLSNIK